MDPALHKRYLEYRERHVYFGSGKKQLTSDEFFPLDQEQRELEAMGDRRSDEEEARFVELCALLYRD